MHTPGASPSCCAPAPQCSDPVAGLHCPALTHGETLEPKEGIRTARVPETAWGPRSVPVSCPGPSPLSSPAASPSSCAPACPWPNPHGKILQPQAYVPMARVPAAAVGPAQALPPITGLHCRTYLQLTPPATSLHPAGLTAITSLHLCAPLWQPHACTLIARPLTTARAPTGGPGPCCWPCPCHHVCVCNQPLQLAP